jgi:hypothetical protein
MAAGEATRRPLFVNGALTTFLGTTPNYLAKLVWNIQQRVTQSGAAAPLWVTRAPSSILVAVIGSG